jgi:hypothetical protein
MDDFRVGSVPSSDPYGQHQPSGAIQRKREKRHDDEDGRQQDEAADAVETIPAAGDQSDASETIEDYYLPSDPSEEE